MMGIKYTEKIIEPNRKQKKPYIVVDNGFWVITICFNRTFSTIFAIKPGIYMYIYINLYTHRQKPRPICTIPSHQELSGLRNCDLRRCHIYIYVPYLQ